MLQTFQSEETQRNVHNLIAYLYDRKISHVNDVISRFCFKSTSHSSDPRQDLVYEEKFKRLLIRYLQGVGHPDHPWVNTIVAQETRAQASSNSLYRAQRLMHSMTGSPMRPIGQYWSLDVSAR